MKKMRPWMKLYLSALAGAVALSACAGQLTMKDAQDLPLDKIQALKSLGIDAVPCAMFKGPPPGGNFVLVGIPRGAETVKIVFGPDCQIQIYSITKGGTDVPTPPPGL